MSESLTKIEYGQKLMNSGNIELLKEYAKNKEYFVQAIIAYQCTLSPDKIQFEALAEIASIVKCTFRFTNENTNIYISGVGQPGVNAQVRTTDANGKESIFRMAWNGLNGTIGSFLAWIAKVVEAIKRAVASFIKGFSKKDDKTSTNQNKGE